MNLKSSLLKISLFAVITALVVVTLIDRDWNQVLLDDSVGQLTPEGMDFPREGGGTLSGWAGNKYFREPIDDPVVLFASSNVPGLAMIYYPKENKLAAGTPQMVVDNIELFQGKRHHLVYYFDDKIQKLYYDDELVAESDFKPQGNDITGFVTGVPSTKISESFENFTIS